MILILSSILIPVGVLSLGICLHRLIDPSKWHWDAMRLDYYGLAFGLGFIAFSYYWFLCGVFGFLSSWSLYLCLAAMSMFVLAVRANLLHGLGCLCNAFSFGWHSRFLIRVLTALIGLSLLFTLLRCGASYIEGDSLVYHLTLPKQMVTLGSLGPIAYSEHAFWPLLLELSFIPAEILDSLFLSKWISYLIYFFVCYVVASYVYEEKNHSEAALISCALIVGMPLFFFHAPSSYTDIPLAFFCVLTLRCLVADIPTGRESFVAGLFFGGAMACKYTAIYMIPGLLAMLVWKLIKSRQVSALFFAVLLFFLGTILIGAPFYIRSFLEYGNPVFPFAQGIFDTDFGHGLEQIGLVGSNLSDFNSGTGRSVWDFLMIPISLTFFPDVFGGEKVGPLFLLSLPIIFCAFRKNSLWLLFVLLYAGVWFLMSQYSRYLTPIIVLLAIMLGRGYAELSKKCPKVQKAFLILFVVGMGFQTLWAGYHLYKDYVVREINPVDGVAQVFNRIVPTEDKVLVVGEERIYYFDFLAFRERTFRNFTKYPDFKSPSQTLELLENEGVQYILIAGEEAFEPDPSTPFSPHNYFKSFYSNGLTTLVNEIQATNGVKYRLYKRV